MYIVRADGNASIGAGHLMRCLTIVDALVTECASIEDVLFVCADEASAELVRERGYECFVCNTDYRNMEEELPKLAGFMESLKGTHTFLVDSYYVNDRYLEQIGAWGRVILLDDMQQHAFPVDVVVNYNAFAQKAAYQGLYAGQDTQCYVGAELVPIRPQFVGVEYKVRDAVSNVLITTGGGDQDNIAGQILEIIYDEKINYDLITGRYNPHLQELKQLEQRGNVHILYDVKDMASSMADSDIAVTAGGTTIYELATIGVPFICFSYAENQEALTEYIGDCNIAGYAGAYHIDKNATLDALKEQFVELCQQKEKRNKCYQKEKCMIDGCGASRLARIMAGKM